jgi:hypothetical protein
VQSPMATDGGTAVPENEQLGSATHGQIFECELLNEPAEKIPSFHTATVLPWVKWINLCTVSELHGHTYVFLVV